MFLLIYMYIVRYCF
ncbi:hypothetical protein FNB79_11605 [Formosa sediminum]|uniref:Uncharacterized protein n=1 Tax=Formosa sediminum TaxID=2594004 RepID=A0A516GW36_9FLAO|nr:hypothetical protein FNB79_11605 [Formosa sediminum]